MVFSSDWLHGCSVQISSLDVFIDVKAKLSVQIWLYIGSYIFVVLCF